MNHLAHLLDTFRQWPTSVGIARAVLAEMVDHGIPPGTALRILADVRQAAYARAGRSMMRHPDDIVVPRQVKKTPRGVS